MPNAAPATTYRRILVALSCDDDALVVEVPKHGPVILTADPAAHARLRELVLDPKVPHRKGEPDATGFGDVVGEATRQISELGRDDDEPAELASPDPKYRRIVVALTVDDETLLVEVPQRAPAILRADRTFARLRELVADKTIASAPVAQTFNPKRFFRGLVRGVQELSRDDEPK